MGHYDEQYAEMYDRQEEAERRRREEYIQTLRDKGFSEREILVILEARKKS